MQIYTIHGNNYEDEAAIGLSLGYFTSEEAASAEVGRLLAQAADPEDDEYNSGTQFWYNVYSPHFTADDIGIRPTAV